MDAILPKLLMILGVPIVLWIGANYLWNNKYRPLQTKRGKATPTFNDMMRRVFKFIFVEDTEPIKKAPKFINRKTIYLITLAITIILALVNQPGPSAILGFLLFCTIFARTRKVFAQRHAVLTRMFEVAASEFRYPRGAELNPWGYVQVQEWDELTIPGSTQVVFPAAFRSDDYKKRNDFENHFNGTVSDQNTWIYKWDGSKGVVHCTPVSHIPTMAHYEGSAGYEWNEIPLGVGAEGVVTVDVTSVPHFLVCGTTGGGKNLEVSTTIKTPLGWTTAGEIRVGETIFDENGQETVVTAAHKIIEEEAYEIAFSDGETLIVSGDHYWYTETRDVRGSKSRSVAAPERTRRTLLTSDVIDRLQAVIDRSNPTDTISISEVAALSGIHSTSKVLQQVAEQVGVAEIVQETTQFHYAEQEVQQRQKVSIYDAAELRDSLISNAERVHASRTGVFDRSMLDRIDTWLRGAIYDDHFVSLIDVAEVLGVTTKEISSILSPILANAQTKQYMDLPRTAGGTPRRTLVASATEVAETLYKKVAKRFELYPFIDAEFIEKMKVSIPEVGETNRFEVAQSLGVPSEQFKTFFANSAPQPVRIEQMLVTLQIPGKQVFRKGRSITRYPKAVFLKALIERGGATSCDQRHKLLQGSVKTTLEIMETLHSADGAANHSLPRIQPLQYAQKDLLINPYALGTWLGDGCSHRGTMCDADSGAQGITSQLRSLNLLNTGTTQRATKRIPHEYLHASIEQRRELLAGLMDAGGTVEQKGTVSFTTDVPELAEGFTALVRSLGYLPWTDECAPINTSPEQERRPAYTINFDPAPEDNIFRLPRKQALHAERYRGGRRSNVRYITAIKPVGKRLMRCISVDSPSRLFLVGDGLIPTHNSVMQRNLIFHCIQHPDRWRFLGVDLKRVELSQFKKYDNVVLGVAVTLEDGVEVMRFAKEEMMSRYEQLEEYGYTHFMQIPNPPKALMVMVDEAFMFMSPEGVKTDEGKIRDELHGEATTLIGEIARLGRAAGVHLVLATQRPDASVIRGEIKENLSIRYAAGRLKSIASQMVLDSDAATRVPGDIKGRAVLSVNGEETHLQGYFSEADWVDKWLEANQGGQASGDSGNGLNIHAPEDLTDGQIEERFAPTPTPLEGDDQSVIKTPAAELLPEGPGLDSDEEYEALTPGFGDGESLSSESRPALSDGKATGSAYSRPEDEWDAGMESVFAHVDGDGNSGSGNSTTEEEEFVSPVAPVSAPPIAPKTAPVAPPSRPVTAPAEEPRAPVGSTGTSRERAVSTPDSTAPVRRPGALPPRPSLPPRPKKPEA